MSIYYSMKLKYNVFKHNNCILNLHASQLGVNYSGSLFWGSMSQNILCYKL